MSQRTPKTNYWKDAPVPREQLVLIPTALEECIPVDHPVRLVDEILDRLDWKQWEAAYHGSFGQPPIHPSVMAKILLFAMIRRIRSSRSIEYQLKHSIDFIWLASGRKIDYSTISQFRRKHTQELRGIFQQMIKLAINLGIANLSELCIDGTRVLADANKYKSWTAARLAKVLAQLDSQIAEALQTLETNDALDQDLLGQDVSADRLPAAISDLKARREQLADVMRTAEAMDETRKKNGSKGPAQIPKTDTDARILPNKEGGFAPNYTPMVTTETQSGLIVHCGVMIGNVEHDQLSTILDCVAEDFEVNIERAIADSAYITGENLTAAESKSVELVGPLAEPKCVDNPAIREDLTQPVAPERIKDLPINPQSKRFDKSAFVYDEASDCYYCPAGKQLHHRMTDHTTNRGDKRVQRQIYTCQECVGCPLAALCRKNPESKGSQPNRQGREVMHDEHDAARRRQRARMKTSEAQAAYAKRQHLGELPFAVIKTMFGMRRFLLRGQAGVSQEWQWASTGFNLTRLMKHISATQSASSANAAMA